MEEKKNTPETELKKREALRLSNEESNKLTRDCIRTALLYLMADMPYDKINVTQIIKRSGVSRAGFYRNYSSKDDVLDEILRLQYQKTMESVSSEKLKEDPVRCFTDLFEWMQQHQDYFKLLINARQPLHHSPDRTPNERRDNPFYANTFSTRERYRDLVFRSSLPMIAIVWFQNGMRETPEEMGKICAELYKELH